MKISFGLPDVLIVNRVNNWKRLANFDVRVGVDADQMKNPTCFDRVRTVGQGQAIKLQCNPPIPGRYVSVQMFGKGTLTLCEVSVYSRVGEWRHLLPDSYPVSSLSPSHNTFRSSDDLDMTSLTISQHSFRSLLTYEAFRDVISNLIRTQSFLLLLPIMP